MLATPKYKPPPRAPPPKTDKSTINKPAPDNKSTSNKPAPDNKGTSNKPAVQGWAASSPATPQPKQQKQELTPEEPHEPEKPSFNISMSPSKLPVNGNYGNTGANAFGKNVVFGVPLAISRLKNNIPIVIAETIENLNNYIQEQGILRLAGGANEIKKLKSVYNTGESPNLSEYDCNAVGGALKSYLRELPIPLLIMTQGLKEASDMSDPSSQIEKIVEEIKKIPDIHQRSISCLFGYLNQVAANSETNKMSSSNLAIVFRPTLKLSDAIIICLIDNYSTIAEAMGWA